MKEDPLIEEVREARQEISQECGHDIWKLYERYDVLQKDFKTSGRYRFLAISSREKQPLVR
jgi:hypothetical protein